MPSGSGLLTAASEARASGAISLKMLRSDGGKRQSLFTENARPLACPSP